MIEDKLIKNLIDNKKINYWELYNNTSCWSIGFLNSLGYQENDIKIKLDYFLDKLIHIEDRDTFRDNFFSLVDNSLTFKQLVKIKRKDGSFKEYHCISETEPEITKQKDSKIIVFQERKINTNDRVKTNQFYFRETAEMTSTGSWYIDFLKRKSYWDLQTRKILEYPEEYMPSIKTALNHYQKSHQELANKCFLECGTEGKPFDVEIKMVTKNNREFWARAIGKPVFNDNKDIIGVRGVFQDINTSKEKELNLQRTSNIVASQNKRLFNFAHIVSHNLRSHTSNLTLVLEFLNSIDDVNEKLELLKSIDDIAISLNETIEHLNEVVTIQTSTNKSKVSVSFDSTINLVKKSISQIIAKNNTTIHTDFSNLETIDYIPAYLESILLNLITNAIKYKHPDRSPLIYIKTYKDNSNAILEITDNGLGIDLEKFGHKIFGMYNTFHLNKDAKGIGLFITKNQIEALNGEITVESKVNQGTTFKIKF